MMKKTLSLMICLLFLAGVSAQQKVEKPKIYHPEHDAKAKIAAAVAQAKKEGKHVLLQLGGNWCGWCILFDEKVNADPVLKKLRDDNYIVYHVNFSQENYNEEVFAELGYPQRFGFPVFVVLDENGTRLHTQNSEYLEEGKGHNKKKIEQFFNSWSPMALDPARYKIK